MEHLNHGWLVQKELSLHRAGSTAHIKMDFIWQYNNFLEESMTVHNLKNSSNQIYNVDETGTSLTPCPPNVVTQNGQIKVHYRTSGRRNK